MRDWVERVFLRDGWENLTGEQDGMAEKEESGMVILWTGGCFVSFMTSIGELREGDVGSVVQEVPRGRRGR